LASTRARFSIADCAFTDVTNLEDNKAVAVQVSINFIKSIQAGDTLIAEATRVSQSKTFRLCSITASKENKELFSRDLRTRYNLASNPEISKTTSQSPTPTVRNLSKKE
jgi:acyl-coenzyme A thioesterase PaaI-like protein